MPSAWNLTVDTKCWALVQVDAVTAHGQVEPRLALDLQPENTQRTIETELHDVAVQVALPDEVLAEGRLSGEPARHGGRQCRLDAPVSRRALDHVTDRLAGVFAKLKGAFEALPGAPKNIFDTLPPSRNGRPSTPWWRPTSPDS